MCVSVSVPFINHGLQDHVLDSWLQLIIVRSMDKAGTFHTAHTTYYIFLLKDSKCLVIGETLHLERGLNTASLPSERSRRYHWATKQYRWTTKQCVCVCVFRKLIYVMFFFSLRMYVYCFVYSFCIFICFYVFYLY